MVKIKVTSNKVSKVKNTTSNKKVKPRTKRLTKRTNRPSKSKRTFERVERGVVYISHLPHGFYEDQLQEYFNQFGKVTNVSMPKSENGNARGYAFVEFKHPEVGKIAAETMNNYLMFNRVVKAKYLEPKEQKPRAFAIAKKNQMAGNTLMDKAKKLMEANKKRKNRRLKVPQEAELMTKLMRKCKARQKRIQGLESVVEINKANAEDILEKGKKILEAEKKAKEAQERRRLKKEAEEKAAKEAAEKERLRVKRAKRAEKKRRLRALKILKLANPNYEEEMMAAKLKKEAAGKKKLKRNSKKKNVKNEVSEDKSQETDGSIKTETNGQAEKKNAKPIKPKTPGNEKTNSVESKSPVGVKSKKLRHKKQRKLEEKPKPAPLIIQQTLKEVNADLLTTKKDQQTKLEKVVETGSKKKNQKKKLLANPALSNPSNPSLTIEPAATSEKQTLRKRPSEKPVINPAKSSVKPIKRSTPSEESSEALQKPPKKPRHRSRKNKE